MRAMRSRHRLATAAARWPHRREKPLVSRAALLISAGRPRVAWRTVPVFAGLLISVSLAACGESKQEKAQKDVCNARAEISKQIAKLQALTLSASAVEEAKSGVKVIGDELKKIKNAQGDLAPARREQVEPATKAFEVELKSIAANVGANIPSGGVESALKAVGPRLKASVSALAGSYKRALAPINCS
jgi:hypothetical protein